MSKKPSAKRTATVERKTKETRIALEINLDGSGAATIETGVGFLDHMLDLFARHAQVDLNVRAEGDLKVDGHHTTEDVGICLGDAIAQAAGDKKGIRRFGFASVPLDEALAQVTLDLSGRGFLVFEGTLPQGKVGQFDSELTEDFFQAFANHGKITLHCEIVHGRNTHHAIECLFKATARALRQALEPDPRESGVPSTKGVL